MSKVKSVRLKKAEMYLKDVLTSALYELDNSLINSLVITRVDCAKGKYDAKVYFDSNEFDDASLLALQKELKKATHLIMRHTLNISGWFKCPKFVFKPDTELENTNRVLNLIKQIHK